ncbi:MAG: peroxiredoxin [Rhodanobacteraceae bacterium]|jgi:peroxiredoxin Q/BCP|nr:peroxiredoxin [Rhodanobacteraceae bacterium]
MLEIGQTVPPLTGVLQDGGSLALADLRGHPVVVYFYPKDHTPGCTREAQDFRDLYPQFRQRGCEIVGVSRDSAASHGKFRDKHALPFPLVADTDETWCNAFGVLGEKTLYGRRFVGVIRSTFLLDADGVLVAAWRGVKVPGHAAAVLERLPPA